MKPEREYFRVRRANKVSGLDRAALSNAGGLAGQILSSFLERKAAVHDVTKTRAAEELVAAFLELASSRGLSVSTKDAGLCVAHPTAHSQVFLAATRNGVLFYNQAGAIHRAPLTYNRALARWMGPELENDLPDACPRRSSALNTLAASFVAFVEEVHGDEHDAGGPSP